jgi:hypothetical protein
MARLRLVRMENPSMGEDTVAEAADMRL